MTQVPPVAPDVRHPKTTEPASLYALYGRFLTYVTPTKSDVRHLQLTEPAALLLFSAEDSIFVCLWNNLRDLEHCCRATSLNFFLRQCNSAQFGDMRMAVPEVQYLLDDIIVKADEAIAGNGANADLRFGHDYQLLAICARMGVKGIAERLTAQEAADWPGWQYTPFAGNVQLVFYKNRSGDVLVKFFINERETSLLGLDGGPYYNWQDLKSAWTPAQ